MFQLVERPAMFPGRSLLETVEGPFVDTGVEMDLGGRVYIDRASAAEIARLLPSPEVVKLRDRNAALEAALEGARTELARLQPIADAVREASLT
jgi:hypothetical protein